MKRSITLFNVILLTLSVSPCTKRSKSEDVVLLCTTDVHCGAKDKLGYSAVEAYKKGMQKEYEYVSLLDAGDFIQGDVIREFSNGQSIVDIMNEMDYEVVTIGAPGRSTLG